MEKKIDNIGNPVERLGVAQKALTTLQEVLAETNPTINCVAETVTMVWQATGTMGQGD